MKSHLISRFFKKAILIGATIVLIVFLAFLVLILLLRYENGQVILFGEDTKYAPLYKESVFDAIAIGAYSNDVLKQLGEPLYGVDLSSNCIDWVYSGLNTNGVSVNFRMRVITFDSNGRVIKKEKGLYVD